MATQGLDLVDGLSRMAYVMDRQHALLASDVWKEAGPNIGRGGSNLTISFLSLNRASLSEKLLISIRDNLLSFTGEVLVVDNGSAPSELEYLRAVCAAMPYRTRIVELGRNFGVAGGRNRTMLHVTTDWVMCLDNDIYFLSDPLAQFQQELAVLGCRFMSLPLLNPDRTTLFAKGGHLYVSHEHGELSIGAGSACKQIQVDPATASGPFLGTFLFGGACIVNRASFERMGGYDEGMFVGFEDIDFSIRLFQEGYKVGASGRCALVHDHPKPSSDWDRNYERERFSRRFLHDSAIHLERKHGFKVWSDTVDHWLESRQRDLELGAESHRPAAVPIDAVPEPARKARIALVIDTDNWAFGNIARQLQKHLAHRFEFVIIPMDVIENINQVLLLAQDCAVVHFFWREHLRLIGTPYFRSHAESLGIPYAEFERAYIAPKIFSTSIYDHLLLGDEELRERTELFTSMVAGYTVASEKLREVYSNLPGYPAPSRVVEDGVDLTLFKPADLDRFALAGKRDLILGWVGNSKWAAELEDFKGVHTILKPAIEQMQQEGLPITTFFADRQERFITHHRMADYYSKIDVLICVSKIEGTPNPVLEAMACGVPVISTDVGIVPQVFGELQRQFILEERSVSALCDRIRRLVANPGLLQRLSVENLSSIRPWDWSVQAAKFGDYFKALLATSNV